MVDTVEEDNVLVSLHSYCTNHALTLCSMESIVYHTVFLDCVTVRLFANAIRGRDNEDFFFADRVKMLSLHFDGEWPARRDLDLILGACKGIEDFSYTDGRCHPSVHRFLMPARAPHLRRLHLGVPLSNNLAEDVAQLPLTHISLREDFLTTRQCALLARTAQYVGLSVRWNCPSRRVSEVLSSIPHEVVLVIQLEVPVCATGEHVRHKLLLRGTGPKCALLVPCRPETDGYRVLGDGAVEVERDCRTFGDVMRRPQRRDGWEMADHVLALRRSRLAIQASPS